jgi:hypothetical protein
MRTPTSLPTRRSALALLALSLVVPSLCAADDAGVAGTWTWSWKDGEGKMHKHVLDIESAAGKLTGRERMNESESVKVDDLKFKDGELSFAVSRDGRRAEYKGKLIGGKTLNGVVNVTVNGQASEYQWTAERALEVKKD